MYLKIYFTICLFFLLLFPQPEKTVVSKQVFTIEGNTSLGTFKCNYVTTERDTILWNDTDKIKKSLKYVIPSQKFSCGNFLLNSDFRKTIKAAQYKNIGIEISEIRRSSKKIFCNLKLQLAGKEKTYTNLELEETDNYLEGSLAVNFSDFELKAPKKLGGLVKVKEDIHISIMLNVL